MNAPEPSPIGDSTAAPRSERPLPEVGSQWRARRMGETKRVVEVVSADQHFIVTRTLISTWGDPPRKATTSRLRSHRFHYEFNALNPNSAAEG